MILSGADILADAKKRAGGLTQDDTVLLRWLNLAYAEDNLLIARIAPDYFYTTGSLSIVAGTHTYNLPADFARSLKIEDGQDNPLEKVNPLDEEKPDGWFFAGSVITAGVRYERIRLQPTPDAAQTLTLSYFKLPESITASATSVPDWPDGTHELLVIEVLLRWMEEQEEDERFAQYKKLRNEKRELLYDLITDRHEGTEQGIVLTHAEDMD